MRRNRNHPKMNIMKKPILTTCTLCCLLTLPVLAVEQNTSSPGAIDFGSFAPTEDGSFVEIKVNNNLINMAARLTEESEPDIARILGGLRSIRINVMKFDEKDRQDMKSRVQSIRSQLDNQNWEKIVNVKEETEDVGIYVNLNGEESIEGVVVTVMNEDEVVLINVDGSIRPEELAQVGERLNLEPLKQLQGAMDNDHEESQ
jgi:hypothetical protein